MKKELAKIYDPSNIEEKWYKTWLNNDAFKPKGGATSHTIMIPPPNVTGILHLGHVLNNSLQDVFIRRARMQGKNALWLPGTDHASIATEAKVTNLLSKQNIDKKKIGRDKFLEHCWEWTDKYGGIITKQLKRLGCSCDWSKEEFTMNDNYYDSVIQTFIKLYNDGLIYQGRRMINWDPDGLTALSNEEVIYKEEKGSLWHLKYPIKDSDDYLIVATTRPETMLGDTGVAVNPKDSRYKKYIGKTIILPITNREIPIFEDEYVDKDFGTGCVKVTPAHDPNDYQMALRNDLEVINIMNRDASFNNEVPKKYQNKDRFEVRKLVLKELDSEGYLLKIEDYVHKVGHSERTDAVVEPRLSKQWFVKMDGLAKPALKAVKNGDINFYPERWTKIYNHWLNNIQDWCISRQLWWGHQIPIWYKGDEVYCGKDAPKGKGWVQDEDVLDTWFSSWIWPLATLGWPNKENQLKDFYPTQEIVTGPDIIFFWVARMIMAGLHFEKNIPFSKVYFTSIIRDEKGRKMSKSLGNSPDPIDLFDKYGVDAVRVSILMMAPQGLDILFKEDRLEQGRNFMNKLWNCSRFVAMNIDDDFVEDISKININDMDDTDKWILSKLNHIICEVDNSFSDYKINDVIKKIYNFVWGDYCDWYIEFSKSRFYGVSDKDRDIAQNVAVYTLKNILKILHPFAPYITEEIWSYFKGADTMLINAKWPEYIEKYDFKDIVNEIELLMQGVTVVRNIKTNLGISPKKKINIFCRGEKAKTKIFSKNNHHLESLVNIDEMVCGVDLDKPEQSATGVLKNIEIFLPLKGLIDIDKELDRLNVKIKDIKARMDNVKRKLDNDSFINKAPEKIVNHEKEKYNSYLNDYNKLMENYNSISSSK